MGQTFVVGIKLLKPQRYATYVDYVRQLNTQVWGAAMNSDGKKSFRKPWDVPSPHSEWHLNILWNELKYESTPFAFRRKNVCIGL